MLRALSLSAVVVALAACAADDDAVTVSLRPRRSVRSSGRMVVDVYRDGYSEAREHAVTPGADRFTAVVPADATWLVATLLDVDGKVIARGEGEPRGEIILDPADFAINVTGATPALAATGFSGVQLARVDSGRFTVAWETEKLVRARTFESNGAPYGVDARGTEGEVRVGPAPADIGLVRADGVGLVSAGDRMLLTYKVDRGVGTGELAFLTPELAVDRRVPAEGGTAGSIGQLSAAPLPAGGAALAWVDDIEYPATLHVSVVARDGTAASDRVLDGARARPQLLAWKSGLVLASIIEGSGGYDVAIDRFDVAGAPIGTTIKLETAARAQSSPRVAPLADGLVVAWITDRSVGGETVRGVRAARLDAAGVAAPAVDLAAAGSIDGLSIAAAPGDRTLLAWEVGVAGGDGARRGRGLWTAVDAALAPRFAPRPLTTSPDPQLGPSIVSLSDGEAVVVWTQLAPLGATDVATLIRGRIVYEP